MEEGGEKLPFCRKSSTFSVAASSASCLANFPVFLVHCPPCGWVLQLVVADPGRARPYPVIVVRVDPIRSQRFPPGYQQRVRATRIFVRRGSVGASRMLRFLIFSVSNRLAEILEQYLDQDPGNEFEGFRCQLFPVEKANSSWSLIVKRVGRIGFWRS